MLKFIFLVLLALNFSSFGKSYCPNANGKCCFEVGDKNEQCMCVLHPKDKPSPLQSCFYNMACGDMEKPGAKICPSTCIYENNPPLQCNFDQTKCSIIQPCATFTDTNCYADYVACLKKSVDQEDPIRVCYQAFLKCVADFKKGQKPRLSIDQEESRSTLE